MPDIKISPKYGLNPSIPVCFWCGKEKNEVALLGRISKKKTVRTAYGTDSTVITDHDVEAPRHAVFDYVPCEECRKHMEIGITLLAATSQPCMENMKPVETDENGNPVYPYPWYLVITEDAVKRLFTPKAAMNIIMNRKAYVPIELIRQLTENEEKG